VTTRWHKCLIDPAKVGEQAQRTLNAVEELLCVRWTTSVPGAQLENMLLIARVDGLITRDEELSLWRELLAAGLRTEMVP